MITSSGVLVTLLFGLSAAITSRRDYTYPAAARVPLYAAFAAFVIGALLAVLASVPFVVRAAETGDLERIGLECWREEERVARRRVAGTQILELDSYRRANRTKARLLLGAVASQFCALIALSITVAFILAKS